MKAVVYARVSTRTQEEAGTIETQLDRIYRDSIISARFGTTQEMEHYLDNGISGRLKPLWQRPAGKRLLADAKEGAFDTIIVYKFNRLGRKASDTSQAIEELLSYGVTVYDVKNQLTIDNGSAAGKLIWQMMGIAAEFEVNNDIETMRDGLERKAASGELMPSVLPLGYLWSQVDEKGHKTKGARVLVDSEEAALVRLIFDRYELKGQRETCRWLNEQGYRMPRKMPRLAARYGAERLFYPTDIKAVIDNPLYTGMVEWGRTTKRAGQAPTPYSHHFPELQIISFDQFNRVRKLRESRATVPTKSATSPYIYSGLLRCPHCGGATVGQGTGTNDGRRRYFCRTHREQGESACKGWLAYETTINLAVIPFLADLLGERLGLRERVEANARQMAWEEHEGKAQRLQAEVEAARTQLRNVQKMTVEGLMTAEEAKPFIYGARETIERNERQLEALRQRIEVQADLSQAIARVCSDLPGALARLEPLALQMVVRQVFKTFCVEKHGHGLHVKAEVTGYEFREEIKDLLAQRVTLSQPAPMAPAIPGPTCPGS